MTYVEYAVNVLGIELLPYQKDILNKVEQCEKEGKKLTINIPQRQGKALLNNCIQQKFGYDRGIKDASIQVIRNVLTSLKEIQRGFGTLEEYIDQLEASVKKEMKTNEQWKLDGHCNECRRKRYCGTECKQHKERLYRVIAKKMDEKTHGVFSQIMNRRVY